MFRAGAGAYGRTCQPLMDSTHPERSVACRQHLPMARRDDPGPQSQAWVEGRARKVSRLTPCRIGVVPVGQRLELLPTGAPHEHFICDQAR